MEDLTDKIKPYIEDADPGDENDHDIRHRLAPDLKPGERMIDGVPMYSADFLNPPPGWWDEDGNLREFSH
jgi:hypothetical protein